jgi:hypothetical protein
MSKNKQRLFRLTKFGHQLVDEALKGYKSILSFCEAHKDQKIRRQTFTKFHNGEGVERGTAGDCCIVLKIPNWHEDWDKIFELVPDKIADWIVYDWDRIHRELWDIPVYRWLVRCSRLLDRCNRWLTWCYRLL